MTAEAELNVDDEMRGGQQTNLLIELQKEEKMKILTQGNLPLSNESNDPKSQNSKQVTIIINYQKLIKSLKRH